MLVVSTDTQTFRRTVPLLYLLRVENILGVILTYTFNRWHWKSIASLAFLIYTNYMPSVVKIGQGMLSEECAQGWYERTDGRMDVRTRGRTNGHVSATVNLRFFASVRARPSHPSVHPSVSDGRTLAHAERRTDGPVPIFPSQTLLADGITCLYNLMRKKHLLVAMVDCQRQL